MKIISFFLLAALFLLTACSQGGNGTSLAALYAGEKSSGWYYFSKNCSATLCPPR